MLCENNLLKLLKNDGSLTLEVELVGEQKVEAILCTFLSYPAIVPEGANTLA